MALYSEPLSNTAEAYRAGKNFSKDGIAAQSYAALTPKRGRTRPARWQLRAYRVRQGRARNIST